MNLARTQGLLKYLRLLTGLSICAGVLRPAALVDAHEGEQHGTAAPGPGAMGGPVTLSPEARANLGLQTAPVETRRLTSGPVAFGMVEAPPGRTYIVSSRIAGRALRVMHLPGDMVRAGEPLVEIESRVVADPPPRVTLSSAISGTVIARTVDPGQSIEPDAELLTVADLSHVNFRADVFEVDLGQIQVRQRAIIQLEAYDRRIFEGRIVRVGQVADITSRTVPVWVEMENPDRLLRLNLRGRARIVTRETPPVLAVPTEALLGDAANRFVYLADGSHFIPTPVQIGLSDDGWTEVKGGLLPEDEVVTTGNYELQYVVTPKPPPAKPAAAAAAANSKKNGR